MTLTINDILTDHNLRMEETLEAEISDQAKIHQMIFESAITETLLKTHQAEQQ